MTAPVVVTGSSGRLGRAIAAALGPDAVGVDLVAGPHTAVVGSIADAAVLDRALDGAIAVVHAAALHAPHLASEPPERFAEVNVAGTHAVLEAAARHGVTRVVHLSTTSLYGHALVPDGAAVWVTEALAPRPRDAYDETKLAAEALCEAAPLSTVSLRVARCFPEPPRTAAIHGLHRSVALQDVVAAVRLALARSDVTGALNVCGRSPFGREDCAELLADAAAVIHRRCPEVAAAFARRGWQLPASIDRVYDPSAAESALGHRPSPPVVV